MADSTGSLKHSPLDDRHRALGAKMADFGGWEMPIEYPGGGVLREHEAVRTAVGVFDVSHLGKATVRGPGAAAYVDGCLTNALDRIKPGQAQYTLCCDDASGGVVDDLIVYLRSDDDVLLVPNAANTAEVVRRLRASAPPELEIADRHEDYGVIAVQGPRSGDLLDSIGLPTTHGYMSFTETDWHGDVVVVCRTGYTGEHGYELLPAAEDAGAIWDALLEAGTPFGVLPCGLGARDTLRTEMGYPLHGHELSLDVTPVQAGLGWAVGWDKPTFWGRDVLVAERANGPSRRLRGLLANDRAIPRPEMPVRSSDGTDVGHVTSGTFSPTLRKGIGLALLDSSVNEGDEVVVDVRGRPGIMQVVKPPFVDASPR
ncbi:MAG: aminomethyltransferase [Frankiales bacterium]|nr:aminomethyltransferase [Frankiales bacterium]